MKKLLSSLLLSSILFTAMPTKKAEAAWGVGMASSLKTEVLINFFLQ